MGEGTGRYVFAVTRGVDPAALDGLTGLRSASLEVVTQGDLQAVVCTVPLEEFDEDALRANLEDLAWLEEVARTHNDVVWQVAERGTTAPMRLVTIYADDEGVRRRLAEHAEAITASLDGVEGRREWSVKVYAATQAEQPASVGGGASPDPDGPGAGAAYLRRKKEAAQERRAASDTSAALAEEIHRTLAGLAVAARRLPAQDPRLTGRQEPMVLNGAYLVPDEDGDGFREAVRRVGETRSGVTVEIGGPWPPYSFTSAGTA